MESLYPDFKELFESLNSAKVRYPVLGGYAVIYHGYRRATDDLDIWIAVDKKNAERVSGVLQKFAGFSRSQVPPEMFLAKDLDDLENLPQSSTTRKKRRPK